MISIYQYLHAFDYFDVYCIMFFMYQSLTPSFSVFVDFDQKIKELKIMLGAIEGFNYTY